jgi:hypothetical protein
VTTGAIPDRPTAIELVQAVREFLERDVMDATEGRVRFHARVAVNALGMVERELAGSPLPELAERARADERRLAAEIRAGAHDDDAAVRADVRERVRRKLLVANPSYLPADAEA